jgi:hypothetical protein
MNRPGRPRMQDPDRQCPSLRRWELPYLHRVPRSNFPLSRRIDSFFGAQGGSVGYWDPPPYLMASGPANSRALGGAVCMTTPLQRAECHTAQ